MVKEFCKAKTNNGSNCKRLSKGDSEFCWQHDRLLSKSINDKKFHSRIDDLNVPIIKRKEIFSKSEWRRFYLWFKNILVGGATYEFTRYAIDKSVKAITDKSVEDDIDLSKSEIKNIFENHPDIRTGEINYLYTLFLFENYRYKIIQELKDLSFINHDRSFFVDLVLPMAFEDFEDFEDFEVQVYIEPSLLTFFCFNLAISSNVEQISKGKKLSIPYKTKDGIVLTLLKELEDFYPNAVNLVQFIKFLKNVYEVGIKDKSSDVLDTFTLKVNMALPDSLLTDVFDPITGVINVDSKVQTKLIKTNKKHKIKIGDIIFIIEYYLHSKIDINHSKIEADGTFDTIILIINY